MIEVTVAHLGLDRSTNTPVVILREKEGARVLPIWIGPAEASAIAMELQGMKAQRPLTHDDTPQLRQHVGGETALFRGSGREGPARSAGRAGCRVGQRAHGRSLTAPRPASEGRPCAGESSRWRTS